ncbi:MAG: VOC family protein [Acidimicrobiia bacterium]|nr:VOC family protein [Acidimicrobiia bacterium]
MRFEQHITFLPVADIDVSDLFYRTTLGLELALDQGDCRIYRIARDAYLGICVRDPAGPSPGVMITLVTHDVDTWHRRLLDAGTPCDRPPTRNERYGIYQAFYRDPDGHVIEIQRFDGQFPAADLVGAPD